MIDIRTLEFIEGGYSGLDDGGFYMLFEDSSHNEYTVLIDANEKTMSIDGENLPVDVIDRLFELYPFSVLQEDEIQFAFSKKTKLLDVRETDMECQICGNPTSLSISNPYADAYADGNLLRGICRDCIIGAMGNK